MQCDHKCPTLICLGLALAMSAVPGRLVAATHVVTNFGDSGAGTLRTLMNTALAGDTILIPPGTIVLTGAPGENANGSGDLDVLKDLTIVGAGDALTAIDANHVDRIFQVNPGITVTISGLTIRNGSVDPGDVLEPSGGGLLNRGITTVVGVVVENNFAGGGGGIANFAGSLRLIGSTVRNNSSTGVTANGGGISNFTTLDITHSTIHGNTVFGTSASTLGGGIINVGQLTMSESTVVNNTASGNFGGGIYSTPFAGAVALANVTIAGNRVGTGLGGGFGGGLSTVSASPVTIVNTLIAQNQTGATGTGPDCYGAITSLGHNLVQNTSGCGLVAGAADVLDRGAGLRTFGDNGGPTWTYSLNRSSRAVDAGDPAACAAVDQRGIPPSDGDGDGTVACDVGAFEFVP